jgi:hypothetical protein
MREDGERLKDEPDVALMGLKAPDVLSMNPYLSRCGVIQPCNHAHHGGLAAA